MISEPKTKTGTFPEFSVVRLFSTKAKELKAYMVYANGSVESTRKFSWFKKYPSLESGADVRVPQKVRDGALNAQRLMGITSSLATMVLVIAQVNRQI